MRAIHRLLVLSAVGLVLAGSAAATASAEIARVQRAGARPTDPGRPDSYRVPSVHLCGNVCLHWVRSTADAPPLLDADGDGVPDWVETNAAVLEHVWQKEVVEFGFRPPKSDIALPSHGPDGRLDVYLQDIGDEALGYCRAEIPAGPTRFDLPAFCVLDDDYSPGQLGPPARTGLPELEDTVAHELFHAIQFAYDAAEDPWFLEGTAAWVEDAVYDTDGAYRFFTYSPLLRPEVPLDLFSRTYPFQYGSWVFWRFLSERLSGGPAIDPSVIRRIWERADALGEDLYSLESVAAVAQERGTTFRSLFGAFATANLRPSASYREGREYPAAPVSRWFSLGGARRATGAQRVVLDHLSNRHVGFRPGAGGPRGSRLTVRVDAPPLVRGAQAALVLLQPRGAPQVRPLALSPAGDAALSVPFGRLSRVVLVLTNASARYECWRRTVLSCAGLPLDDDLPYRYSASLTG